MDNSPSALPRPGLLRSWLAGLAAFLVAATLLALLIILFIQGIQNARSLQAIEATGIIRSQLEGELNRCLALGSGLAALVRHQPDLAAEGFPDFAAEMLSSSDILRNISLLKGSTIIASFPLSGNEKAIGQDLLAVPSQAATVRLAMDSGQAVFAGPIGLVQGGQGIISRIPIFLDDRGAGKHYWGQISLVINMDKLFGTLQTVQKDALDWALAGLNGDASSTQVFWGKQEILDQDPIMMEVHFPNGMWRLYAKAAQNGTELNPLLALMLTLGALLALGFGLLAGNVARTRAILRQQAFHDYLTGLPNRALFEDRLSQVINQSERGNLHGVLFLLDLDGFKLINDRHGHQAGDRLLSQVAKRLEQALRRSDTVARIGGDEFAVITPLLQESNLTVVHNRIRSCFEQPFELDGRSLVLGMSIGHALYPEDGRTGEILQKVADERMYRNKRQKSA